MIGINKVNVYHFQNIVFRIIIVSLGIFAIFEVSAQDNFFKDGILNGKDDSEFAERLAQRGYYELSKEILEQISNYATNAEQRLQGNLGQCSLLQSQALRTENLADKEGLYQKATKCYESLIDKVDNEAQRWEIELELGNILIQQAENWIQQTESASLGEKQKFYDRALPVLEQAHKRFQSLKAETDDAGSDIKPRDKRDEARAKKAEIRYHSWYGICRVLYFQGLCGKQDSINKCLEEVQGYLWEYEGKLGAFYAMILRGMALHEKKNFANAVSSYDGVLEPLQMYASVYISEVKRLQEIFEENQGNSVAEFLQRREKWWDNPVELYLFSVAQDYRQNLNNGELPEKLRREFVDNKNPLSKNATARHLKKDSRWSITDKDKKREFQIVRSGRKLEVFQSIAGTKISLSQLMFILKTAYKIDLVVGPEVAKLNYEYQAQGTTTIKTALAHIVKDTSTQNVPIGIHVFTHSKTKMLCLEASYQKVRTLVKWNDFEQAIECATAFADYFEAKYGVPLDEENVGQALLLELAKAYLAQGVYDKAMSTAENIASKQTYWGFVAKKTLQEWAQLNSQTLNAKSFYLIAMGLWKQNKYLEAILNFLKVVEYAKTQEDVELYGLDAWEKLGQCYWFLNLYLESANAYEICTQKLLREYKGYRKIVATEKGSQKIDVTPKMAYWAYRAYRESFKITKNDSEQKKSDDMGDFLVSTWKEDENALNLAFYRAQDKEQKAEQIFSQVEGIVENAQDILEREKDPKIQDKTALQREYAQLKTQADKLIEEGINACEAVAEAYGKVTDKVDLYESAQTALGKTHYKKADLKFKKSQFEARKFDKEAMSPDAREEYEKALDHLTKFYKNYAPDDTKKLDKLDWDTKIRKVKCLTQALFYSGKIYAVQGKDAESQKQYQELYQKYPEDKELAAAALYLLTKFNIEKGNLEEGEKLLHEMQGIKDSNEQTTSTVKNYQTFCYYLVGKKFLQLVEDMGETEEISKQKVEYFRKASDYLWEWKSSKQEISFIHYDWLGSKWMRFARLLVQYNQPEEAQKWYTRSFDLFQELSTSYKIKGHERSIYLKILQCAMELQNWEEAIYVLYPLYQSDKENRKKEMRNNPNIFEKDPLYVNYLSQILRGLAVNYNSKDSRKLYLFLIHHAHRDFMDDIDAKFHNATDQQVFERYVQCREMVDWVASGKYSKTLQQDMNKEFEQKKKINANQRKKEYQSKCQDIISSAFPKNPSPKFQPSLSTAQLIEQTKRLSLLLASEFTYELVNKLPRNESRQKWIFSIDGSHQKDLDEGKLTANIVAEFTNRKKTLSSNGQVKISEKGKKWIISDKDSKKRESMYYVEKKVQSLNVYIKTQEELASYDNPEWWEAKYRQIELVYLQGKAENAYNLIKVLELQQPGLGGQTYLQKFNQLAEMAKKTNSSQK